VVEYGLTHSSAVCFRDGDRRREEVQQYRSLTDGDDRWWFRGPN